MNTLFEGNEALKRLITSLNDDSDLNEAQTRFHIIDYILFNCLSWDKSAVQVEKAENRKFTDYELGSPRLAILEAKREGITFEIPAGVTKSLTDLNSLIHINSSASEAIMQAQDYCSKRGVPIAIVSNGHQYIIFLASRQDGISVFSGKAVVFTSLEDLSNHFDLAWKLISYPGIKDGNIFSYLLSSQSGIPHKLSSKLIGYPTIRYGSEMQATLRQLSELLLQDVIENKEIEKKFFEECYCSSGALSKYALLSKNILEARYASLFSISEPAPFISSVKDKKNDNFSPDIFAEAIARRPIVLLGDVGVGKTSFVKNLKYHTAFDEFKNAIYIYIDLGSKATLTNDLKTFVINEIESQLLTLYDIDINSSNFIKGVYASERHRFAKGHWGDIKDSNPALYQTKMLEMLDLLINEKDQHLKRSIASFSKSSKRQVIITIDNADQRDYEIQQSAFIISQELAKEWSSTVFISVRPQTFFKSKRSGALAAYPHKIFTISPPRVDQVIEKRLNFALKMAQGNIPIDIVEYININAINLANFIKALITSLQANTELNEFLANITGGNIRTAIDFVTKFIGSPNVDAEKIIKIMSKRRKYIIPLHEFTKSALLGDYSHYNPDTSIAMNVFDVTSPDPNEHFLVPIIIAYLNTESNVRDNDGFCTTKNLFEELQNCTFTVDQISNALRRCTNKKLIETSQRITFEEDINGTLIGDMPTSFRVTSVGIYHLKRWLGVFTYLDAMLFDTPIFDESIRETLITDVNSLTIENRYERTIAFKSYLNRCWSQLPYKPPYFNFSEILNDGISSFKAVSHVIGEISLNKSSLQNQPKPAL